MILLLQLVIILILTACLSLIIKKMLHNHADQLLQPPGSLGFPFFGETMAFYRAKSSSMGVYEFAHVRYARYGKSFKTRIMHKNQIFLSSTEAAKIILMNNSNSFSKRYLRSISESIGEQSLLCASHEVHKNVRYHMSKLFNKCSLSLLIKTFDVLILDMFKRWEGQSTVIVRDDLMELTFSTICKLLFSTASNEDLEILRKDVQAINNGMLAFPLKLPWTNFNKGIKARQRIMRQLSDFVASRRNSGEVVNDLLQSLIILDDDRDNNSLLTDDQIKDNILTLIIAGQTTTTDAISWMVKHLDETPAVQDKLRELHLSMEKACGLPLTTDDLNEMVFASKIVKESLRMATIVPWFPRVALRDCCIDGYYIRKGWIVNVDAKAIHWDPSIYADPQTFNPSRFDVDGTPYSFLAFGAGERTCLGMNFAKAMMLVFLHRIVTTFRWRVTDPDNSLDGDSLFPRLKNGCPIIVTPLDQCP